jgi:hypothetical protein
MAEILKSKSPRELVRMKHGRVKRRWYMLELGRKHTHTVKSRMMSFPPKSSEDPSVVSEKHSLDDSELVSHKLSGKHPAIEPDGSTSTGRALMETNQPSGSNANIDP